jgi:hypothetical protein
VVDAVRCAGEIQRAMADRDLDLAEERRLRFRIGVNLGDVIVDGDDIYGDGVNIADGGRLGYHDRSGFGVLLLDGGVSPRLAAKTG